MENRIRLVGALFLVAGIVLIGRLFFWQIVRGKDLADQARGQQLHRNRTLAHRGNILASDGTPLAASQDKWLLFAQIPELKDNAVLIANQLAPLLVDEDDVKQPVSDDPGVKPEKIDYKDLLLEETSRISNTLSQDLMWVPLEKKLDSDTKQKIEDLSIHGLGFDIEEDRLYPEASSSAHLLGFVGKDSEGNNKGYFGLEGFYDFSLTGSGGYKVRETDALGNPLIFGSSNEISAKQGLDLLTHIDKTVQLTIETKLAEGLEKYGALSGNIIVMNPKTGAIMGMASNPYYDPREYFEYSDELFRNPAISDAYEPGSIFKPIVMAAGIDAGVVEPETVCDICGQPLKVDKYYIRTWNNEYHAGSTMTDVIKNSDNVGMAFVADRLGSDRLYDYLDSFGFGHVTGIDLQGEATASIRERGTWNIVDLATMSFGQGIAVTPIQMITAGAVIANDGKYVVPQVVDKFVLGDWEEDIKPEYKQQVISKEAADKMTQMMVVAASQGEAKWAIPKGYKIAGKTGTAQIPVAGHYDEEKTIASFIGFAPPNDPEIIMLVTLREPESSQWASETAAPLWFDIARVLFPHLGIKPG